MEVLNASSAAVVSDSQSKKSASQGDETAKVGTEDPVNVAASTQQQRPQQLDADTSKVPPAFKKRSAAARNFRRRGNGGGDDKAKLAGQRRRPGDSASASGDGLAGEDGAAHGKSVDEEGSGAGGTKAKDEGDDVEGQDRDDDDDGSRLDLLADLREEQRARRKGGGRSATALMGTKRKEENALVIKGQGVDGEGPVEAFGLKPEPKAPNISTMIESQFKSGGTGGWGGKGDGANSVEHEQLMEQYVQEKMGGDGASAGAAGEEGDGGEGKGDRGGMLSEEDRLYTIPDDFKKKVEEAKQEFDTGANKGNEMDGEVGSGAQIAWNTGLAEIALPIEFKLKNMEDTLAARDKLEATRAARRNAPGEKSSVSGSLTANYSHHQREWALQIRELQNRQAMADESQKQAPTKSGPGIASNTSSGVGGSGGNREGTSGGGRSVTGPGGIKLKHSSDNAVLERFKKRTRRF